MDLGGLTAQPGMSLSISLRPVPASLVSQIQSGHYVEMRDLLGDNAAIGRQLEDIRTTMGANVLQVSSRPRVRDVTSLESWLCCFLSFLAVGTAYLVTRERLAYAILIIRESLQHGGSGWLQYDRLFCQQAAMDHTLPWNVINPGLQATTTLAQRSPAGGQFCSLCQDCDHSAEQCALAQLQHQLVETASRGPTTPMIPQLKSFFIDILLPELLTMNLCRPPTPESTTENETLKLFCVCRKPEYGDMIACDNPSCPTPDEWYHYKCVNIKSTPRKWYCLHCKN